MRDASEVFLLFKSDPDSSSSELARFISGFPGAQDVWITEGAYSFIARFSVPEASVPLLPGRLLKNKSVLEIECVPAPLSCGRLGR